jgi:16S rRNA (cytosine1402-N4)-methyltransferase
VVSHISVLPREVLEYLDPKPGGIIVDATVGLGGHSREILKRILPGGRLVAIDQDEKSLSLAKENLKEFSKEIDWIHGSFRHLSHHLRGLGIRKVSGILMDLGISSYQLSDRNRGFSFLENGILDMRMNTEGGFGSVRDVLRRMNEHELARVLFEYGQERHSRRIARFIVEARRKQPLQNTLQLAKLIEDAVGRFYRNQKIHPATRTFQALRIYVNDELKSLEETLPQAVEVLESLGRLVVISFHSLEDGIVKKSFQKFSKLWGGREGGSGLVRILTRKPVRPSLEEIEANSRSRSARLRAVEKI